MNFKAIAIGASVLGVGATAVGNVLNRTAAKSDSTQSRIGGDLVEAGISAAFVGGGAAAVRFSKGSNLKMIGLYAGPLLAAAGVQTLTSKLTQGTYQNQSIGSWDKKATTDFEISSYYAKVYGGTAPTLDQIKSQLAPFDSAPKDGQIQRSESMASGTAAFAKAQQ